MFTLSTFVAFDMQVEGSVVHIMKALASHPCGAQSLIEDDSLQLLFQMVVNGSLTVFMQYREGLVPLHSIQLHRHAMQASLGLTCSLPSPSIHLSLLFTCASTQIS